MIFKYGKTCLTLFSILILTACGGGSDKAPDQDDPQNDSSSTDNNMTLSSHAFKDIGEENYRLPLKFTCDGKDGGVSPSLTWSNIPSNTQSLVITLHSTNPSNMATVAHFSIFNIPPDESGLAEGSFSIGTAAEGDMSSADIIANNNQPYSAPCPSGDGVNTDFTFTLYALSQNLSLTTSASQSEILTALEDSIIEELTLVTTRKRFDSESLSNDLHVPSSASTSCEEKTAHFNEYSRVHDSLECDEASNQMNIVSHISSGLKTEEAEQQLQVGVSSWIGRLSLPSQEGSVIRITPSFLTGENNNLSCDGTGVLGMTVDGQIILPYYKQADGVSGNTCGEADGLDYADRDTVVLGEVDQCYGHSPNGEGYHLHGAPICLMDVHDPSKPIAYMSDGIPLYFGEGGGTITNTTHAQTTSKAVTDNNYGAGQYEHLDYRPSDVVDGSNPLNACNAYDLNGDGAVSGYVYYTSKDAPYTIGCFMGEELPSVNNFPVERTRLETERTGWAGQTLGDAMDVDVLANYTGTLNGLTYNITEVFVNSSNSFLTAGDTAQVFWRILSEGDTGYQENSTCFKFVYRADSENESADESETICTERAIPDTTLDFTAFGSNAN